MMAGFYASPYVSKPTAIKCPACGREIARFFKKETALGIPEQKCRKCGADVYIENYIPWQQMSGRQKTGTICSVIFQSVILGIAFGGLIGAVLLFIVLLIWPRDLSEFPLLTCYVITTVLPVLFFMARPWYKFYRVYKQGKKRICRQA